MFIHIENGSFDILLDAIKQTIKGGPKHAQYGYCVFEKFALKPTIDFSIGTIDRLDHPRCQIVDWEVKTAIACDEEVSSYSDIYLDLWRKPKPGYRVLLHPQPAAFYHSFHYDTKEWPV